MNRTLAVVWILAAACGGVDDRERCAADGDCPAGQYCAHTGDGSVCWEDAAPPSISGVKVTCPAPCLRDGVLRVEATVADDRKLGPVAVALDLAPARSVPMVKVGAVHRADLPLAEWPFPAFERRVIATVTAVDGARNAQAVTAAADQQPLVTRARWSRVVDPDAVLALTAPAVMSDGAVVVAGSNGKVYFVGASGSDARAPVTLASASITVPPAIADDTVWVGTQAGGLYAVASSGSVTQATCSPEEPITGAPAVLGSRVIASSQAGALVVADVAGFCDQTSTTGPVTTGPVITAGGHVLAPASGLLHSYTLPASGVLRVDWTGAPPAPYPPSIGDPIGPPMAVDASDAAWTLAQNGSLNRTTPDAATRTVATVASGSSGAIILADGSAVLGTPAGRLERVALEGTPPWTQSAALSGAPAVPLALGGDVPALLVPTSTGRLYALAQADGQVLWEVKLSATGQALQPANVHGAPGARTATAYVSGADGVLHAVVVDGPLDAGAPWPKAFHDARNTSNAGAQP